MGRLLWPLALVIAFLVGLAVGGVGRKDPAAGQDTESQEMIGRLQQQVATLQARLRAREDLAASRQASGSADRFGPPPAAGDRVFPPGLARAGRAAQGSAEPQVDRTSSGTRATNAPPPTVAAALERFYKYLEATNGDGRGRWREARELVDELRAMGPAAGQALMQVLAAGNDSDERRAAARLLGTLQVAQALPLLKDIIDKDNDLLLRRAAAYGLRQLQTPESIPVMERLVAQPAEDRFVRLSAAVGLADSGKPQGVAGLVQIFDETTNDGRGRDIAFRALVNLQDERSLPFMRQVVASQAEPSYRLQAIRYLTAQGDQQSLATLHVLMTSPSEQPSIRDAAAAAYRAIGGK
jgi:hypothetical protein